MVIKAKVKAVPGDLVRVQNYRTKDKEWEDGKVSRVKINVREDGSTSNHYTVWVSRPGADWPKGYHVTVGDEAIAV